mgnify:CR=1 FL=1
MQLKGSKAALPTTVERAADGTVTIIEIDTSDSTKKLKVKKN